MKSDLKIPQGESMINVHEVCAKIGQGNISIERHTGGLNGRSMHEDCGRGKYYVETTASVPVGLSEKHLE